MPSMSNRTTRMVIQLVTPPLASSFQTLRSVTLPDPSPAVLMNTTSFVARRQAVTISLGRISILRVAWLSARQVVQNVHRLLVGACMFMKARTQLKMSERKDISAILSILGKLMSVRSRHHFQLKWHWNVSLRSFYCSLLCLWSIVCSKKISMQQWRDKSQPISKVKIQIRHKNDWFGSKKTVGAFLSMYMKI